MLCHFREWGTNVSFEKNRHRLARFGIHVCPSIRPDVMLATVDIEGCDKLVKSRRRCWVEDDEHWCQTSGTGFARERKFFGKAALAAGGNGNAKFEFVGELVLAIIAINLTAFVGRFVAFIQAFNRRVL